MENWSRGDILTLVGVVVAVLSGIGTFLAVPEIHDFFFGGAAESRTVKFTRLVAAFLVAIGIWVGVSKFREGFDSPNKPANTGSTTIEAGRNKQPPKDIPPRPQASAQGEVAVAYADFSGATIRTKNISVTPEGGFVHNGNASFGGSWLILGPGGGFNATLTAPKEGKYALVVTHLSSLYVSLLGGCRGRGYSPVTIEVNSATIANNYDPAENHGGTHQMVTDRWMVNLHAGENLLHWTFGSGCTHYWIHRVELQSVGGS